jgi:asparagine synthetase A
MYADVISKSVYQILSDLTQESRLEVALPLAIKDWIRLKLKETREQRKAFERRYGMEFQVFKQAWDEGRIENKHSYEVERDYWEWEATVTDEERLHQMLESLP